jgi:hypothetical protein
MRASRFAPSIAALGSTLVVGLAAAGCSVDTPAQAAVTAPATSAAPASSPTGIAAKLLTARDMPAGWVVDASATNPIMDSTCPLLNPSGWNKPLAARAEADLKAGMAGPFLVEEYAGGDSEQVSRAWQELVAQLPKCTTFTHSVPAGGSTFTITKKSAFPSYGSGSYAFTLTIDVTGGVSASGDIAIVRTPNAVVSVYIVGISGVQETLMEQSVAKAVAKANS